MRPTSVGAAALIMPLEMTAEAERRFSEPSERRGLVLVCGGTPRQRELARADHGALLDGSEPVAVSDVQSLLRCAARSKAVIVCGELGGMSVDTVERLIRERAPHTRLIRDDRAIPKAGLARRRGPRGILSPLGRRPGIPS